MKVPILVGELELTEPISGVGLPPRDDGQAWGGARLLVRMQRMPVGYVCLSPDDLDAAAVAREVWRQLSPTINAQRSRRGLAAIDTLPTGGIAFEDKLVEELAERPLVSVVLNTRNRPASVVATLRGLLASSYRPFEIVLVDNAPSSDATKDAVLAEFGDDPRVRYVREPRQGTSWAKNHGVAVATGDIIAFTDDDVRVDQWWLDSIVRGFGRTGDVACVTGLIATGALDNAVQLYFDQRAEAGFLREGRVFDLTDNRDDSPLYPYSAGVLGGGANFALTRSAFEELGGFNTALGAGAPCRGGEDLDVFMRTVLAGHRLVYEPSAIVWHVVRAGPGDLPRQMRAWGAGNTAALTALVLRNRKAGLDLLRRAPVAAIRLSSIGERTKNSPAVPSGMAAQELRGMVIGPWLYLKARRKLRRESAVLTRGAGAAGKHGAADASAVPWRSGRD
jgi:cellulose synthase/poly-beta-1,6-N-acetylglucosamine synthase-like glycosyltransferase